MAKAKAWTGQEYSNKWEAVLTEARRMARNEVKDEIRRGGGKLSHFNGSDITNAALALIVEDSPILRRAKESLQENERVARTLRARVPAKK